MDPIYRPKKLAPGNKLREESIKVTAAPTLNSNPTSKDALRLSQCRISESIDCFGGSLYLLSGRNAAQLVRSTRTTQEHPPNFGGSLYLLSGHNAAL